MNKDYTPIYYKSVDEMGKPLSELIEKLRIDIFHVRGKLYDIKSRYGWEGRIDFIEGGLTCMLVAMHSTVKELESFEEKVKEKATPIQH